MTLHAMKHSRSRLLLLAAASMMALPAFAQNASAPPQTDPSATAAPAAPAAPAQAPAQDSAPQVAATTAATESSKPADFKQLDANKDGKLSRDEVAGDAMWTADFDAADTNKDGYLSKAEFRKHEADLRKTAKIDKHG